MKEYKRSVIVKEGNFEKSLRKFKKMIQDQGLLVELRDRESYEKPTTRRKKKKAMARARLLKKIRDQQLPKRLF